MKKFIIIIFILFAVQNILAQTQLKVITYNILDGFNFGKDSLRRSNFQKWMNQQDPDVAALQELCNYTEEKLTQEAQTWGHQYAVLLKTTGYSVGITSKYPIVIKEKIIEGLHHGALHCKINNIDYLVIHLHPGSIKRRREESKILIKKLEEISAQTKDFIVLGDFNSHSPFDADLYDPNGYFIKRLKASNKDKGLDGNIYDLGLDFAVQSTFLSLPLIDVVQKYTKGIKERGSFPTPILSKMYNETIPNLKKRLERIDYILVSPNLAKQCVGAKVFNGVANDYLSDHYPVQAIFEIKN